MLSKMGKANLELVEFKILCDMRIKILDMNKNL